MSVELVRTWRQVVAAAPLDLSGIPTQTLVLAGLGALLLLVLLLFLLRVALTARKLHLASAEGRRVSAEKSGMHPLTNFTRNGVPSDPLNVKVLATGAQLALAFAAAGWYRADEIYFITSLRIVIDAILGRKYATAPVSNLYLFGRKQDYAFERPGKSVRERDHIRLWDTGQRAQDGRAIWIGGATRDSALEIPKSSLLPTHKIAPDVDSERATVTRDLIATGWVIDQRWEPGFGTPTKTQNATGDPYYTDGQVAVLALANVPVLLPLSTQVRGSLYAGATQQVARGLRWVLPKSGRRRAREQKQAEREAAKVPSDVTAGRRGES